MHRMILALIVTLGLPATTVGQNVSGSAIGSMATSGHPVPNWFIRPLIGPPSAGYPPRDPLPNFAIPPLIGPPSVGLPLPQVGLPLPSIGLQPQIDWNRPARHHWRRSVAIWPSVVFVVPYAATSITPPPAPEPVQIEKPVATGTLVLQVEPGTAPVFIDGYYVGTPDDFSARRGEPVPSEPRRVEGLALETGPHRVDINAPGYESVSFDVKISPNQSIVYRRVLKAVEITTPVPSIPKTPRTFYMIPGCYMGNVLPSEAGLPPTCDVSRAVTFTIR